jgi:hypothetical protein
MIFFFCESTQKEKKKKKTTPVSEFSPSPSSCQQQRPVPSSPRYPSPFFTADFLTQREKKKKKKNQKKKKKKNA